MTVSGSARETNEIASTLDGLRTVHGWRFAGPCPGPAHTGALSVDCTHAPVARRPPDFSLGTTAWIHHRGSG
jgi:hypothetical protein